MIILDIGANSGTFSNDVLSQSTEAHILAIEPNRDVFEHRLKEIAHQFPGRFSIDFRALGDTTYRGILNHVRSRDGQLASLKVINPDSSGWQQKHLEFMKSDISTPVDVITPAQLVQEYGLTEIQFLKIDIQGNDIDVLKGFLDSSHVRSGVVEVDCGFRDGDERYLNSSGNDINRLFQILYSKGLRIIRITPNNSSVDELNIFFGESIEESNLIMNQICISSNPAFARFWRIQGLGLSSQESTRKLSRSVIKKVFTGIRHPIQSFRSILLKLSR